MKSHQTATKEENDLKTSLGDNSLCVDDLKSPQRTSKDLK